MTRLIFRVIPALGAVLVGTTCTLSILYLLMSLNREPMKPPEKKIGFVAAFEVKTAKKRPADRRVKRKPRPQREVRPAQAAPPTVGVGLSGIDFGLPGLAEDALKDLTDSLLPRGRTLKDVVMTREAVDVLPRPLSQTSPRFPQRLHREGVTAGVVVLSLLIGTDGSVQNVQVVSSSHQLFERSVLEAVRDWRFEPAQYRGQAVPLSMRQTIHFRQT